MICWLEGHFVACCGLRVPCCVTGRLDPFMQQFIPSFLLRQPSFFGRGGGRRGRGGRRLGGERSLGKGHLVFGVHAVAGGINDRRRDINNEVLFRGVLLLAAKEPAQERQVAQDGHLV